MLFLHSRFIAFINTYIKDVTQKQINVTILWLTQTNIVCIETHCGLATDLKKINNVLHKVG